MGWSNFGVAVISQQNMQDAENITRAGFWNVFSLYSVSSKVFQAEHLFYYFTTLITVGQTTPAAYLSCQYVSTPHQVIGAYKHFFWSVGAFLPLLAVRNGSLLKPGSSGFTRSLNFWHFCGGIIFCLKINK